MLWDEPNVELKVPKCASRYDDGSYGLTLYLVTLTTHYSHKWANISFSLHLNKINLSRFFFIYIATYRKLKNSYYPENRLGIHDNCDMYLYLVCVMFIN